ncbi:MAG: hypothetical protein N2487_05835, partial [Verrucomicrobiae bacterium]|nr:hypothetical protein [Verrucomicrobiae bacterium]
MSCFVVIFVFLFSWTVFGQELSPRVGYVYPAGGKRGTVFELTAGGQFLRGVTNVYVSGGGVRATVLEHIEPISQRQAQLLRDRLKELQQKRAEALKKGGGWSAEEQKMVEDIRKKLANFIPPRDLNPSLADIVRVRLEVSDDAEPGERQIRFQTAIGLSNPNVFYVGEFDEFSRKHRRIFRQGREERDPVVSPSDGEIRISLPSVLNGQIMPGGVDRYRFLGKKGQKVVVMVLARQLIPYIPDAVPGWFQAVATIYNSRGEEVVRVDDFMFNPDPVLYFEIPADGDYVFEIRDAIYRGREDFVYRVVIGEIPFITGIFPAGATAGKNVDVELKGWNLPTNRVRFDFGGMLPGIYQYRLDKSVLIGGKVPATSGVRGEFQGGECAAVLVHLSEFPDVAESESNNSTNFAQSVMLP